MQLPRLAIQNFQFTVILFLALLLLGIGAFVTMPFSEDPPLDPPEASIFAFSPGTSPVDIEHLIVEPLEEVLNEIEDIKDFYVSIEEGLATITILFYHDADGDEKYREVKEKVNKVRHELPQDLMALEVNRWSTNNVNILQLALASEEQPYRDLYEEAKRIKRTFERIEGVRKVEIHGAPAEVVQVAVDLDKLALHQTSLDQVMGAIHAQNANIPGGNIDIGQRRLNVKTSGNYQSLDDIRQTVIQAPGGQFVYLKDVADVNFGYEDQTYITRYNGSRCLFISVQQNESADIFWITDVIKNKLPGIRSRLPGGMDLEVGFDQSIGVSERVNTFFSNLVQGVLLVGCCIFLVIGFRSSLIVMTALPVSFLIGIGFAYLTGFGMHQMTITGLIIALGLLVDNAIVVTENVHRFQQMGQDRQEATINGASEVAWPTASSTFTTVLAFLPIVLLQDDTGDFMRSMPVTVIYTLLASLLVALTLTPMLSSRLLPNERTETPVQRVLKKGIDGFYRPFLDQCLRHPWITLSIALVVFLSSLSLFPFIGVSFFPKAEKPQFLIDIELPRGTNLKTTDQVTRYVEQVLREQPETVATMSNVGKGNPQIFYGVISTKEKSHFAQIFVLVDESKGRSVEALVRDLRPMFADFATGRIRVKEFLQGPPELAPIEVRISGDNLDMLSQLAGEVESLVLETPGAIYVDNPLKVSRTDLSVRIDREKAYRHGFTPEEIDRVVRAAIAGANVSTYRDQEGKQYDIVVRLPVDNAPSIGDFDRIFLTSRSGAQIPLKQVASIGFKAGYTVINHYNLERTASITADATGRSVDEVSQDIVQKLDAYPWPPNYRYSMGGELESRGESFGGMTQAVVIALVCIFGVLVLQFRSFVQPFVIFAAIPLAIVGSILALFLTGYSFSLTAFIGLTSLVGIVINDSILLVDYTNIKRREGQDAFSSALEAGATRFVPVVLTSVTTIGGLLPLTLQGGTLWAPMGWAIIGGLITSTMLTLVVVPVLYLSLARVTKLSAAGS